MNPAVSVQRTRPAKKKYSPLFLAVFAVLLVSTTICVGGVLVGILSAKLEHHDTICFWASGNLLVHRTNPYDRQAIQQIQASVGFPIQQSNAFVTRNPPSALFLMAPIGLLGPKVALIIWALFLAGCLILSVWSVLTLVKDTYERGYLLLAWFFAPALCCIEMGQTGLIVLLGLALFLRFHDKRPLWAGAGLSLCATKPHLLLPFGVVLLAWVAVRKRWWVLYGAAAAIALESLIAVAFDPAIWLQYCAMVRTEHFAGEFIPTIGAMLRFLINRTAMWLEFVPALLGCGWALWYFFRNRNRWDWREHGSLLTLVSLVVAPYAWFTDQVVALPAILFVLLGANKPRRGSVTLLMAIMSATAVQMVTVSSLFFKPDMFLSVAWLGWYLYATSRGADKDVIEIEDSTLSRANS